MFGSWWREVVGVGGGGRDGLEEREVKEESSRVDVMWLLELRAEVRERRAESVRAGGGGLRWEKEGPRDAREGERTREVGFEVGRREQIKETKRYRGELARQDPKVRTFRRSELGVSDLLGRKRKGTAWVVRRDRTNARRDPRLPPSLAVPLPRLKISQLLIPALYIIFKHPLRSYYLPPFFRTQ